MFGSFSVTKMPQLQLRRGRAEAPTVHALLRHIRLRWHQRGKAPRGVQVILERHRAQLVLVVIALVVAAQIEIGSKTS